MWIVAGPNGSGKTTLTRTGFLQDMIGPDAVWLNPDDLAAELGPTSAGADEANLEAARQTGARVDLLIEDGRSFVVETVLSTDKYRRPVERARAAGFGIGLTFVTLASPDLCVERVAQRVALGGHPVPTDRVHARWHRSIANLPVFAGLADVVHVFDNGEVGNPVLLAEKGRDGWHAYAASGIPAVDRFLASL
jgi:predicted ABC-type ATPase